MKCELAFVLEEVYIQSQSYSDDTTHIPVGLHVTWFYFMSLSPNRNKWYNPKISIKEFLVINLLLFFFLSLTFLSSLFALLILQVPPSSSWAKDPFAQLLIIQLSTVTELAPSPGWLDLTGSSPCAGRGQWHTETCAAPWYSTAAFARENQPSTRKSGALCYQKLTLPPEKLKLYKA